MCILKPELAPGQWMLWAPTLSYLFPSSFRYRLQSFPFNRATCPQPNSRLSGHALAYPWLRRPLWESLFAQHWSFCYCLSLGLEPPSVTQETPLFTWFQLSRCHSHPTEISLDTVWQPCDTFFSVILDLSQTSNMSKPLSWHFPYHSHLD